MSEPLKSKIAKQALEDASKKAQEFVARYGITEDLLRAAAPYNQEFLQQEETLKTGAGKIYTQTFATRAFLVGFASALKWKAENEKCPEGV